MPGLLERARNLFANGARTTGPMPFSVRCLCGETLQGERRPEFQILTCPGCGSSVFIFPRCPLPAPELEAARERKPAKKAAVEAKEIKSAKSYAKPEASAPKPPGIPIGARVASMGRRSLALALAFVPPRHWFTVPRVVFASVLVLVAGTLLWQFQQSQLRAKRELVVPEARRGLAALASGDFEAAYEHLSAAVNALEALGEPFAEEARYRQAFREAALVHHLLDEPLEEALLGGTADPGGQAQSLAGRSVLFDSELRPNPDGGWSLGYVAFMDDAPVWLKVSEIPVFQKARFVEPTRVVFGAHIKGIEKDQQGRWWLTFNPDSATFITEQTIFELVCDRIDVEAQTVRTRQTQLVAQLLGITDGTGG